jgi:hypothetical protein
MDVIGQPEVLINRSSACCAGSAFEGDPAVRSAAQSAPQRSAELDPAPRQALRIGSDMTESHAASLLNVGQIASVQRPSSWRCRQRAGRVRSVTISTVWKWQLRSLHGWRCHLLHCCCLPGGTRLGAPWGEYTQRGGTSGALASSGRLFAAVSCVLSIVMAGAILARAGEGPLQRLPARVVTVLAWVATA